MVITLLRMIGWRNLLIGIMALALILLVRRAFLGQSQQEVRVNALFDQVDFVQELNLVTYYSEELLQIGGAEDLNQEIRSLQTQERDLQEEEIRLRAQTQLGHQRDSISSSRLLRLRIELRTELDRIRQLKDLIGDYPKLWAGARNKLRSAPNTFGQDVARWYRHIENLGRSHEAEAFEDLIMQELARQVGHLENEKIQLQGQVSRTREQIRVEERSLKSIRRDRNDSHQALVAVQSELEQVALTLQAKQGELAAIDSLENSRPVRQNPPKLMAVVSTGVSAKTDLKPAEF